MILFGQNRRSASSLVQLRVQAATQTSQKPFEQALAESSLQPLRATGIAVLQVSLGKFCNQTCGHCHVEAGPDRREMMHRETAELCIRALSKGDIPILDITGGAPELNPNFRWLVEQGRALGRTVIDRCNLTVMALSSQAGLAEFLAANGVEVAASLPYFTAERHDAQRGAGVFQKSLEGLRLLNSLGYGRPGSGLVLNLVYNPTGAFLPGPQHALDADFRRELSVRYGIVFNALYAIANMPIGRFLDFLVRTGNHEHYMQRLVQAYNPQAAAGVMCRQMLSVGWDGTIYDCDFNQMLGLPLNNGYSHHIRDFDPASLAAREIATGQHCYGCTAGGGSSCGGAVIR